MPEAAASAPSKQPTSELTGQRSDLNQRWTAALSTAAAAPVSAPGD